VFAGYAVCLAYLALTPMFWLGTGALSDIICIFFTMTTVLFLVQFVQSRNSATMLLVLAGLFTALASLTRFMGAIVLIIGLVAILARNTKVAVWSQQSKARAIVIKLKDTINQTLLYVSIGLLPSLAWQLYRFRGTNPGGAGLETNVYRVLHTTYVDFLGPLPREVAYALMATVIVSLTLLIVRGKLIEYLKRNLLLISYIVAYSILLVVLESVESTEPISTRYVSPIYPFILLIAVPLALYIYKQVKRTWARLVLLSASVVVVFFFVWFQVWSLKDYTESYNMGFNEPAWIQASGIDWMANSIPANAILYSNCIEPLQWKLDRPIYLLPMYNDEDGIKSFFANLAGKVDTFIICQDMLGIQRMSTAQVDEANAEYNILQVVAEFPRSKIWRLK